MKLTKEQKFDLKEAKKSWVPAFGVNFVTCHGVVTIAWYRPFPGAKMIRVATSYYDQSEDDRFRTKTGEYYAGMRLTEANPQFVQLPLGDLPDHVVDDVLKGMFIM
jgi:hypothetical protein